MRLLSGLKPVILTIVPLVVLGAIAFTLFLQYTIWADRHLLCEDALIRRRNYQQMFVSAQLSSSNVSHNAMESAIRYRDSAVKAIGTWCSSEAGEAAYEESISRLNR